MILKEDRLETYQTFDHQCIDWFGDCHVDCVNELRPAFGFVGKVVNEYRVGDEFSTYQVADAAFVAVDDKTTPWEVSDEAGLTSSCWSV